MPRWRKNDGATVAELPKWAQDAEGHFWTGLATNAEARAACGWADAGIPDEVDMAAARTVLSRHALLTETDDWVRAQGGELEIFWFGRGRLRRSSSLLATAVAARGWSEPFVDQLFIEADAVGL